MGRYGGEEFVVVLAGCDTAGARAAAERLRASVAGTAIAVGGLVLRVTCSLGIAVGDSGTGWDRDRLLNAADAALYRAKRAGRNRIVVAGEDEEAAASTVEAKPAGPAPASRRRGPRPG